MQVLFEIMLQIKQKRGIGVENTSPRNFSDGLALSSSEFVTYMRALTPSPVPTGLRQSEACSAAWTASPGHNSRNYTICDTAPGLQNQTCTPLVLSIKSSLTGRSGQHHDPAHCHSGLPAAAEPAHNRIFRSYFDCVSPTISSVLPACPFP